MMSQKTKLEEIARLIGEYCKNIETFTGNLKQRHKEDEPTQSGVALILNNVSDINTEVAKIQQLDKQLKKTILE